MTSLCLVCCVSLQPLPKTHTTDHPAVSPLSDLQHLLLVPFSPFSAGEFLKGRASGGRARSWDWHPACLCSTGAEQPGWVSCYTPVQEAPSAKRPPEPCFSERAKELKRTSHPWQLKSITACLQDSGSEGRLGKWPRSLCYLPMFLFGERDSWFSMAWDGFREQDGFREHWSSLSPAAAHRRRCKLH